jgi:hypothetical protein
MRRITQNVRQFFSPESQFFRFTRRASRVRVILRRLKVNFMSNLNLHNITNNFQDVRLISLRTWRRANEISPRDQAGPYVVLQEGYDPQDMKMIPTEFLIGRSGKWIPLAHFYKLPVPERREEFVFGTAAEVMQLLNDLPSKAVILGRDPRADVETTPEEDDIAAAIEAWRNKTAGSPSR